MTEPAERRARDNRFNRPRRAPHARAGQIVVLCVRVVRIRLRSHLCVAALYTRSVAARDFSRATRGPQCTTRRARLLTSILRTAFKSRLTVECFDTLEAGAFLEREIGFEPTTSSLLKLVLYH